MKALGIYVIYDRDGTVDDYVYKMLKDLLLICDNLVVVINGNIDTLHKDSLKRIANNVYIRRNSGFDAGAYADVIVNYLGKDRLCVYDTIVLCNDTFYGTFKCIVDIFDDMKKYRYDYWGIDYVDRDFLSYIVTYFCVFEGKKIISDFLFDYFSCNVLDKIGDIHDAFARFEVGLTFYAKNKGYRVGSYCNCNGVSSSRNPDVCCIKYGLPIWKKKYFEANSYKKEISDNLLAYLREKLDYDVNDILSSTGRKYGITCDYSKKFDYAKISEVKKTYSIPNITYSKIRNFVDNNDEILIYGIGSFGKATHFIFKDIIKDFRGFVSTCPEMDETSNFRVYSPDDISAGTGVIIALNEEHTREIIPFVNNLNKTNPVLLWW